MRWWSRIRWMMGSGRGPAAPGAAAKVAVWLALGGVVALAAHATAWINRVETPARTLLLAGRALDGRASLRGPLDVAWSRSLVGAAAEPGGAGAWRSPLPPPICAPGITEPVRRLDAAIDRGDPAGIERALRALRSAPRTSPVLELIVAYGVARGLAAAGDPSAAARELAPSLERHADGASMPTATLARAQDLVARGVVTPERAALVYHARHLAGVAAYERGEVDQAVLHHRRGLNALNYVLAGGRGRSGAAGAGAGAEGHYQAFDVELGAHACPGSSTPLSSMDGYAALVRAYLAAEGFRDPTRVADEVRRGRFDLDRKDPLAPVLRYAQAAAPDFEAGPIPERFVWAASNLQRVYHHNRLRPDPRLEAVRGALILELAARPDWLRALSPYGVRDACGLVRPYAEGLLTRLEAPADPAPADSALAAVGLAAWGWVRQECGANADRRVDAVARGHWLRRSGGRVGGGLPALYESRRMAVLEALTSRTPEPVTIRRLEEPLELVRAELDAFEARRTPPHLSAGILPRDGAEFVRAWWTALFRDAAEELLDRYRDGDVPTAAAAPGYLLAVNSAIAHAGVRPVDLYAASELAPLARAQGDGAALRFRARHWLRSHPLAAAVLVAAGAVAAWALVLVVFVNVWRFRLLARDRLYAGEVRQRQVMVP